MTDQPRASIMVPIYNAEEYLAETLDSICAQTYENLEIILVDDGSTDRSGEICDAYAAKDVRVHVFHMANGGVAEARNVALSVATGEYGMFVDADDLLLPEYAAALVQTALDTGAPLVICGHLHGKRYSRKQFFDQERPEKPKTTVIPLADYRYNSSTSHEMIWGCLFAMRLAEGKRFDTDLHVGEDTLFFAMLLKDCGQLAFVQAPYYYYTYRADSLIHRDFHEKQLAEITSWERVCALFADQSRAFQIECRAALALRCKKNYYKAVVSGFPDKTQMRSLWRKAFRCRWDVFRSRYLRRGVKTRFAFFIYLPDLYRVILRRRAKSQK